MREIVFRYPPDIVEVIPPKDDPSEADPPLEVSSLPKYVEKSTQENVIQSN